MSAEHRFPPKRHGATASYEAMMRPWARLWGLPGLEAGIEVRFDLRLRRVAGRCNPVEGRITLSSALYAASARAFETVLCHEAAHVAAFHLHGRQVQPHGHEWAALVTAAGFRAGSTSTASALGLPTAPNHNRRSTPASATLYIHSCAVCQTTRVARRPVRAWRCAECVAAGLEGRLEISTRPRRLA